MQGEQGPKGERGVAGPGGSGGNSISSMKVHFDNNLHEAYNPFNSNENEKSSSLMSESKIKNASGFAGEPAEISFKLNVRDNRLKGDKNVKAEIYKNGKSTGIYKDINSSTAEGIVAMDTKAVNETDCTTLLYTVQEGYQKMEVKDNSIFKVGDEITFYEGSVSYEKKWTAKITSLPTENTIVIDIKANYTTQGSKVCKGSGSPTTSVKLGEGDSVAIVCLGDKMEDGGDLTFDLMSSNSVAGAGPTGLAGPTGEKGPQGPAGSVNYDDPATIAIMRKEAMLASIIYG